MLSDKRRIQLCRAREQLRRMDDAAPSIDNIARAASLSRFHFVREFRAVFGETPAQCRTRARLDRAKQLLLGSDASVTDICMDIGFSSVGSFSTLFRKQYGLAPSRYRHAFAATVRDAQPGCLDLLHRAWHSKTQKSRSASAAD